MKAIEVRAWLWVVALVFEGCVTSPKESQAAKASPGEGAVRTETIGTVTVTTIPVGIHGFRIAGGEGALWVGGRKCLKLDTRSNCPVGIVPEASVCDLAYGEGALWATTMGLGHHELRRIDPDTGEVVARIPNISGRPAVGSGSVWVHEGRGKVFRIDPKANRLVSTIKTPGVGENIVVGEDTVWVLERSSFWPGSENLVSRIDPTQNRVAETIRLGPGICSGLAVSEGAVWVGQSGFTGGPSDLVPSGERGHKLLRIDPTSNRIVRVIPMAHWPMNVAYGRGWVWVSTKFGHVARVDPKTNQVVEEFLIGGRCYKEGLDFDTVLVADGALWLCGFPGREIFRIDL